MNIYESLMFAVPAVTRLETVLGKGDNVKRVGGSLRRLRLLLIRDFPSHIGLPFKFLQ